MWITDGLNIWQNLLSWYRYNQGQAHWCSASQARQVSFRTSLIRLHCSSWTSTPSNDSNQQDCIIREASSDCQSRLNIWSCSSYWKNLNLILLNRNVFVACWFHICCFSSLMGDLRWRDQEERFGGMSDWVFQIFDRWNDWLSNGTDNGTMFSSLWMFFDP